MRCDKYHIQPSESGGYSKINWRDGWMNGLRKFVGLALLFSCFFTPAVVMALNLSAMHGCRMGCGMAKPASSHLTADALRVNRRCCELSPVKTAPASMPQLPRSVEHAGALIQAKAIPAIPSPNTPEPREQARFVVTDLSLQAVLCTFLV